MMLAFDLIASEGTELTHNLPSLKNLKLEINSD